jgi:hypothetical protein
MGDTITDEICHSCHNKVWVNLGNFEDCTVQDYEGFICPYCKAENHFEGADEIHQDSGDDPDDFHLAEGHKTPNEAAGLF